MMVRQITHKYQGLEVTLRALVNRDRGTLARFNRELEGVEIDGVVVDAAEAWAFARLCHQWVSAKGDGWCDWRPPALNCVPDELRSSYSEWSMLPLETGICAGQALEQIDLPTNTELLDADSADPNADSAQE